MEQLLEKFAKAPAIYKIAGILLVVALITAGNYGLVINDLETKIMGQKRTKQTLDAQLAEKQAIAQNLNERRREMDILEQQLAEALTELPEKKDIDELLAQLNDIGKKSGLEINKVEPANEQSAAFFSRIPIKMNVSGNFHEIAMFLQEIANMRRIVNVNNIRLGDAKLLNEKVVLRSDFQATAFRFVEQTAAQPAGKK